MIGAQTRLSVVALASSEPPDGCTHWSTRRLAEKTGIGATSVHRILHKGRLKPHKTDYWCGRSPDPEFEAKQAAVLGLYLDPPSNAPRRLTATYKRHGATCLLGRPGRALGGGLGALRGRERP